VSDKEVKEYEDAAHNLYMEIPEVRHCALTKTVRWIADRC
jgi:alpha-beta hydrolase superfamily lysophospholipase